MDVSVFRGKLKKWIDYIAAHPPADGPFETFIDRLCGFGRSPFRDRYQSWVPLSCRLFDFFIHAFPKLEGMHPSLLIKLQYTARPLVPPSVLRASWIEQHVCFEKPMLLYHWVRDLRTNAGYFCYLPTLKKMPIDDSLRALFNVPDAFAFYYRDEVDPIELARVAEDPDDARPYTAYVHVLHGVTTLFARA